MRKKIEWINSKKMKIDTGHKLFDEQTKVISVGNVMSLTQLSFYIRPWNMTINPAGQTVEPGHLQEYDLHMFSDLPSHVENFVREVAVSSSVILYEFRHSGSKRIVHGYIVTTADNLYLEMFVTGPTYKSANILAECVKYVADDWEKYFSEEE